MRPDVAGYRIFDADGDGELLYAGASKNPLQRRGAKRNQLAERTV